MTHYPFNIQDFMAHLKPVKTCGFMDMCSSYLAEAKQAYDDGESCYEVSGLNTKNHCPWVVFNQ